MDQQTVQQVLQALREGATAASGAAREGFQQVCAYKATVAKWEIVGLFLLFLLGVFLLGVAYRLIKWDESSSGSSEWLVYAIPAAVIVGLLCMAVGGIAGCINLPSNIATMKNPAGAVISDIIKR